MMDAMMEYKAMMREEKERLRIANVRESARENADLIRRASQIEEDYKTITEV